MRGPYAQYRFTLQPKSNFTPGAVFGGQVACASLLLAQNVQPRDLMEILGHSQISLTMNTYSHVVPAALKKAAEQMDNILTG